MKMKTNFLILKEQEIHFWICVGFCQEVSFISSLEKCCNIANSFENKEKYTEKLFHHVLFYILYLNKNVHADLIVYKWNG